jgi:hypothetical protein
MYGIIEDILTIIKPKISLIDDDNFYDFEPGDGMVDYIEETSLFFYFNDSDFSKGDQAEEGTQDHDPAYYIDLYVAKKATSSEGSIILSGKKAGDAMKALTSQVYQAFTYQRFRYDLEKAYGQILGNLYVSRIESLGTSPLKDSKQTIMGNRITWKIRLNEESEGDDGRAYVAGDDSLIVKTVLEEQEE